MHTVKLSIRVEWNSVVIERFTRPSNDAPTSVEGSSCNTNPRRIENLRTTFSYGNRVARSIKDVPDLCSAVLKKHPVENLGHAEEPVVRSQTVKIISFDRASDAPDVV